MATIYLIRHGQASANHEDYDKLSTLGEQQAQQLANVLLAKSATPTQIIKGTLLRHEQTAHYALSAYSHEAISIQTDAAWNEYDHQAILAAYDKRLRTPDGIRQYMIEKQLPKQAFQSIFLAAIQQWISADTDAPAYPESWKHFNQRVLSAFDTLSQQASGSVFVFTSGGPISLIASQLLGLSLDQFMNINWNLVNAGISKILVNQRSGKRTLSVLNEHSIFDTEQQNTQITYT